MCFLPDFPNLSGNVEIKCEGREDGSRLVCWIEGVLQNESESEPTMCSLPLSKCVACPFVPWDAKSNGKIQSVTGSFEILSLVVSLLFLGRSRNQYSIFVSIHDEKWRCKHVFHFVIVFLFSFDTYLRCHEFKQSQHMIFQRDSHCAIFASSSQNTYTSKTKRPHEPTPLCLVLPF